MKRSVSTELYLEPGTYSVLLKITAKRFPEAETVDDVIAKTCQTRRKKLQAVGLSYDMAHAKGHFQELEAEKIKREKVERRERRKAMAKKMHEARIRQRKKTKLRNIKLDLKRQAREMKRFAQDSEQDKLEPFAAFGIIDPSVNIAVQPLMPHPQATTPPGNLTPRSTSPNGRPAGPSRLRTSTTFPSRPHASLPSLAPAFARHATPPAGGAGTGLSQRPGIRVQRARVEGDGGRLTLSDVSSDELSWDSDLDAPSDSTEGAGDGDRSPAFPDSSVVGAARRCAACGGDAVGADGGGPGGPAAAAGGREEESDDEGGFERDPWNAVCVVGLRVYSTESGVRVEVVRGDGRRAGSGAAGGGGADGGGGQMQEKLDVDDAAKDAVEAMRTPASSPVGPRLKGVAAGLEELLSGRRDGDGE
jgi:hypothetical protein